MSLDLFKKYNKEIAPALMKELGVKNIHAVPRMQKIVINVGVGKFIREGKMVDKIFETLRLISGANPVKTTASKSISNFKIRQGMVVGMKVTLRGKKMWDFVEKLVNVTMPRVRDFRGISTSTVDKSGNLSIGFTEHIVFPEVSLEDLESIHGLQVTINTTAKTKERGLSLFKALGFPFKKELVK